MYGGGNQRKPFPRQERTCFRSRLIKVYNQSRLIKGPRPFNSAPKNIRNTTLRTVEVFKMKLDDWLNSMPDEPPTRGSERARLNSLRHQVQSS